MTTPQPRHPGIGRRALTREEYLELMEDRDRPLTPTTYIQKRHEVDDTQRPDGHTLIDKYVADTRRDT